MICENLHLSLRAEQRRCVASLVLRVVPTRISNRGKNRDGLFAGSLRTEASLVKNKTFDDIQRYPERLWIHTTAKADKRQQKSYDGQYSDLLPQLKHLLHFTAVGV